MTIERRVVTYEILFRLNRMGEVVGCHRRDLEILIDGEEAFHERELDPVSITGELMDEILGTINTALINTLGHRTATLNETLLKLEGANIEIDSLRQSKEHADNKIMELTNDNDDLKSALAIRKIE